MDTNDPFVLLFAANVIGFIGWAGKSLYSRLHNVERELPKKVDEDTFNKVVDTVRRKNDENADRISSQLTTLERVWADRHIAIVSMLNGKKNHDD
jgi:hypothetical protein